MIQFRTLAFGEGLFVGDKILPFCLGPRVLPCMTHLMQSPSFISLYMKC